MAAELQGNTAKKDKPILISKLQLPSQIFYHAVFIPKEDSVITVSSDKSIRVWIKRDNGQYWPSVCHYMPENGNCLDYNAESGKVFVGLCSGVIQEYDLSDDSNKLKIARNYIAHSKTVRSLCYTIEYSWLLSCGNDKYFQLHCTKSGKRLGGYAAKAYCTCLRFDSNSSYVFVGDTAGDIHVLKLTDSSLKTVTILKGHSGGIQCVAWDEDKKWLFSGSSDESIIIWDIGGQQGSAFELHGHMGKVLSLGLPKYPNILFSIGEDQVLTIWNMKIKREETPNWSQSDICEKCAVPFFWNFKQMWDQKIVGVRQHHCRKCGRAVCHNCSELKSRLPMLGYEFDVRLCQECYDSTNEEEKYSLASFHDLKHCATHMHADLPKGRLLTCGGDDTVKIWNIQQVVKQWTTS